MEIETREEIRRGVHRELKVTANRIWQRWQRARQEEDKELERRCWNLYLYLSEAAREWE